ncbi:hypothetical protein SELMODRAFT_156451 [Selaginella moellendorffii]|uniref:Uricase n=1 Tax=Selaginella moellendorffii TaxID=88036 RepID=D8SLM9_SELML|nr:uricase-2 isozyme 2 [Selaginella moellendorffii]EFJ14801.1 hypothetical protein SELMODRAFT_156451 [Selaginella moellendorffii]|eukprot:XP_002984291.1 uricase-2 isozyme 2 [Selaginella moellendorffii]
MPDEIVVKEQCHGKARVRVARVWRGDGKDHEFVEWTISIILSSDCIPAYSAGDNSSIVATDSIKNTVYALAKLCHQPVSIETFGIKLASHFLDTYKEVTGACVSLVQNNWERVSIDGIPHQHGFKLGSQKRTAEITISRDKSSVDVVSGFTDLSLLKTTKSGFEGFIRDKFTLLPEVRERLLASTVTAKWRYARKPSCYTGTYDKVTRTLFETFFGPSKSGVYSPSVQNTLYLMAQEVLRSVPEVSSIELNMPNLHFLPVNMPTVGVKFDHDVYLPTSEPHGSIQACLARKTLTSKL